MGLEGIGFSNPNKVAKLNCSTVSLAFKRIDRSVHVSLWTNFPLEPVAQKTILEDKNGFMNCSRKLLAKNQTDTFGNESVLGR